MKDIERDIDVKIVIEKMDHTDFERVDRYLKGVGESKAEFLHKSIHSENQEIQKNNLLLDYCLFSDL